MNRRAVGAECQYILRIWKRSGSHIVMSVVMPAILLLALGFFFGSAGDAQPVVHVDDQADNAASHSLMANLTDASLFQVRTGPAPAHVAAWMLEEGVDATLLIPAQYSAEANSSSLHLVLVGGDSPASRSLVANLQQSLQAPVRGDGLFSIQTVAAPPAYRALLLPGILGLSIVTTGVSVGFASISELRHHGLLQRLAASPMGKTEWLLGRMLGVGVVSMVSVIVLVVLSRVVFGATFVIGPWTLPLVLGGTLVFAGLGTLLGLAVERPEAGSAVMNLILMPLILLSGAFFDLSASPRILQWVALGSPLTHLVTGLRADMLGLGDPTIPGIAMVGFAALLLVGGARLIRWTERS